MDIERMKRVFEKTDYVHTSGSAEELKAAEVLLDECRSLGVEARLESFRVPMADGAEAHVFADGTELPCRPILCCGSGKVEGELYYMPSIDKVSLTGAKDRIVLLDTGVGLFTYKDLVDAGALGILFQYGNMYYPEKDIDLRDLREYVVNGEKKLLCAMLHSSDAVKLVAEGVKRVSIEVVQREYDGESHNVVAEIPGKRDEYITLSAHLDSTSMSHGAYDNMSGCVGLLGVMEALKGAELNYGLRFVFCGSEERGLLGSKAYVRDHAGEMDKTALNINLDMIGSIMGKFIARVTAEERLVHYISYMGAELGFPIAAKTGVYSSDSSSFADKGVPAVSFARIASSNVAPIHCRYDDAKLLSTERLDRDIAFITEFTRRMACSAVCPVRRELPEKVRTELDEYLFKKRKPGD